MPASLADSEASEGYEMRSRSCFFFFAPAFFPHLPQLTEATAFPEGVHGGG